MGNVHTDWPTLILTTEYPQFTTTYCANTAQVVSFAVQPEHQAQVLEPFPI